MQRLRPFYLHRLYGSRRDPLRRLRLTRDTTQVPYAVTFLDSRVPILLNGTAL